MSDSAEVSALPEGCRVEVIERSASGDAGIDERAARPGYYYVYGYAGANEGDDPNGHPYYLLDSDHSAGGAYWAYPERVFSHVDSKP